MVTEAAMRGDVLAAACSNLAGKGVARGVYRRGECPPEVKLELGQ